VLLQSAPDASDKPALYSTNSAARLRCRYHPDESEIVEKVLLGGHDDIDRVRDKIDLRIAA
jgi:hypothetical protein